MRAYWAFTKKELMESVSSYRLLILACVFILFGIMNPLIAKMTPELVKEFMPEGLNMAVPEPTAVDSWLQFFKNVGQIGLAVLDILFSGMIAGEMQKGTLVLMVTKGLSRVTVLCSKFTVSVLLWTVSYVLCYGITYGYTAYFWNGDNIRNLMPALFGVWLFGVLLLASGLLGSVLSGNSYTSLLFTGGLVAAMFLVNIIPKIQKYNPVRLVSEPSGLISGSLKLSDISAGFVTAGSMILIFFLLSVLIFRKKQL
ncbi:ABC transporter permease subunit [Anaerostipes sp.]|uniref:ABC transporter permease subunit n=1 Tax=Anaerostipes sp. TaxID=1872530 RepID=UPI0025BC1D02|nr:ABC transporter permease subunit [Anaerostipes sp.]MBS7007762.1 ABC transporter permease subunit [Anaerostipes sp.]